MMDERHLDRLVTKTNITPASKRALREVRRAVTTGSCGDPEVGTARWSVEIDTVKGVPVRMSFSFKRDS